MPEPASPNPAVCVPRSQLFTVRLWLEDLGDGRGEWRGQVQHALSRETCYFRDWPTLAAFLAEQLQKRAALDEERGGRREIERDAHTGSEQEPSSFIRKGGAQ
jgi:hypothetical protein